MNSGPKPGRADQASGGAYAAKIRAELSTYQAVENVHDLPPSHGYISETYLRPLLQRTFGWGSFNELLLQQISAHPRREGALRVLSLGSGNCDFELGICERVERPCTFVCHELNEQMIARGREGAAARRLGERFTFVPGDINQLKLEGEYDLVIANHSLHHFVELEHIFSEVEGSMGPDAVFVINDMIGRNGHMFWEETLDLCNRMWALLPKNLKYNQQLKQRFRHRIQYDCSSEGFEGIRAQDILPLLDEHFAFRAFAPFYAVINRFIDRDFGHNFQLENPLHRGLLDAFWHLDDLSLRLNALKPTQMIALLQSPRTPAPALRSIYFTCPQQAYDLAPEAYAEVFDEAPGGAPAPYAFGTLISFGVEGQADRYKVEGWRYAEQRISWTLGQGARLVIPTPRHKGPAALVAACTAYVVPGKHQQRVHVSVNGRRYATWTFADRTFRPQEVMIPPGVLDTDQPTVIEFETPDAASPHALGDGTDATVLGLALAELTLVA